MLFRSEVGSHKQQIELDGLVLWDVVHDGAEKRDEREVVVATGRIVGQLAVPNEHIDDEALLCGVYGRLIRPRRANFQDTMIPWIVLFRLQAYGQA